MTRTRVIIPKTPTMFFIVLIHFMKSSAVSAVKPPTIGINVLREYLAVFIRSPSDASVIRP